MDINIEEKKRDKDRDSRIQGDIAKNKLKIFISGTAEIILLITEIYTAIHYKGAFVPMAIFLLAMAIGLFFLVNAIIDLTFICKELEKVNFDDIYRAQKASYLVIRKSFEEMDERLRAIEESSALPADEIINAQKAVAKVTISRSKENTDALMNSNDELINHLFSFEGKMDSNNEALIARQKEMLDATKSDIAAQNADLQSKLNNIQMQMQMMETKLEQGVSVQMPQMMAMPQMTMAAPVPTVAPVVQAPVMPDVPVAPVAPVAEPAPVIEEPVAEPVIEEPIIEESVVEEPVVEEPVVEEAPAPAPVVTPVDDDPNKMMSPDDIAALLASMNGDAAEEPVVEEPVVEEAPAPAPVVTPVDDDPNKMMSPDDIAALLASMNGDAAEAPAAEEPVVEEAPAPAPVVTPVDDDPNRMLSPEEIAALIAGANAEPEAPEEPEAPAEPELIPIPDVGLDLSDPNKVMTPEEIEKLFASL